jgi:hypothetical protein
MTMCKWLRVSALDVLDADSNKWIALCDGGFCIDGTSPDGLLLYEMPPSSFKTYEKDYRLILQFTAESMAAFFKIRSGAKLEKIKDDEKQKAKLAVQQPSEDPGDVWLGKAKPPGGFTHPSVFASSEKVQIYTIVMGHRYSQVVGS